MDFLLHHSHGFSLNWNTERFIKKMEYLDNVLNSQSITSAIVPGEWKLRCGRAKLFSLLGDAFVYGVFFQAAGQDSPFAKVILSVGKGNPTIKFNTKFFTNSTVSCTGIIPIDHFLDPTGKYINNGTRRSEPSFVYPWKKLTVALEMVPDSASSLLAAADQFNMIDLKNICCGYLETQEMKLEDVGIRPINIPCLD
ncbi:hypothetical protein BV898_05063 [Hypsibius exemplaris]|uniref:Uncharacterized protein n=1 Tax=Hypsibius exemplaris TaxID=2072580 RepID=A0A1W0X0I2_HYPEX|nr:hypothetical protein BV898_05063 [Hypsibius exemplaris]